MTILLLDTHAYVWALTDPDRLSGRARTAIEAPSNAVLVSAATACEMAIEDRAGTWPEAEMLLAQHDDLTSRLGAQSFDLSAAQPLAATASSRTCASLAASLVTIPAMNDSALPPTSGMLTLVSPPIV